MKRVLGWFWSGLTMVSLLLCMATAVLWVRSYLSADTVGLQTIERFTDHPAGAVDEHVEYGAASNRGVLTVFRQRGIFGMPTSALRLLPTVRGERRWVWSHSLQLRPRSLWLSTDHLKFFHQGGLDAEDSCSIPFWLIAVATALLPVTHVLRRRRHRTAAGHCPICGYDLRATPDRCPECGTIPAVISKGPA